tara:strand:+ start:256 stop:693 length:438 start_codon:yes stop_codon:yes gene_type:complete
MKIEKLKINKSSQKENPGIQWNDSVIAALGTMPDIILADKAGCSTYSIYRKRVELGVPRFDKKKWREEQIALLGTDTDTNVGLLIGKSQPEVHRKRNELGIEKYIEPVSGSFTKSERILIHKYISQIDQNMALLKAILYKGKGGE